MDMFVAWTDTRLIQAGSGSISETYPNCSHLNNFRVIDDNSIESIWKPKFLFHNQRRVDIVTALGEAIVDVRVEVSIGGVLSWRTEGSGQLMFLINACAYRSRQELF